MAMKANPIWIIGCGPGSPEYVTPLARRITQEADVLVGAQRLLDLFTQAGTLHIPVRVHIEEVLDEMEKLSKERKIVVLVTGDPGLLSLAKSVIARFGRNSCRVMAGVSSLQVAFAALGLDWHDALVVDAHGGLPDEAAIAGTGADKIAVFAGNKGSFTWMTSLADSLGEAYRTFLCTDLTLPTEMVREIKGSDILEEDCRTLSIVIFVKKELIE